MKALLIILFLIADCNPPEIVDNACYRELTLENWLTPTGVDCFIPVFMYKQQPNGAWTFIAAFQNEIPQTIQVEYGGFYAWDFSWCDESPECARFSVKEPGCQGEDQIEFTFTACPPSDYKMRIEKELLSYQSHNVCDACPE